MSKVPPSDKRSTSKTTKPKLRPTAKPAPRPKRTLSQAREYLDDVLSMDPMLRSAEMIELRWNYCGFAPPKSPNSKSKDAESLREQRVAVENRLENVRVNFWTTDPKELAKILNKLNASEFPELKSGVTRLKRVLSQMSSIQSLSSHQETEINLYNTFRRIIMTPTKGAGKLKERYLRQLAGSSSQQQVRKMVKMMRIEFPEVFDIESDWFEQISRVKLKASKLKPQTDDRYDPYEQDWGDGMLSGIPPWAIGLILWVLFRVVITVFRYI